MAATLASMIDRVEALLMDSSNLIWSTATITEGIRLAVGEYSTAGASAVTLNGLDGAVTTTIPLIHESLVVIGSAAYAVQARAIDKADAYAEAGEAAQLKAWADARLREYKAMLGFLFPGYLVTLAGASESGADPALVAAQVALAQAQAGLLTAQAALATAQELRTDAETTLLGSQSSKTAAETTLLGAENTRTAAETALLTAQELKTDAQALFIAAQEAKASADAALAGAKGTLTTAQAAEITGREGRAAAAAAEAAADRAAEAARKAELRNASNSAWGKWADDDA